MDKYFIKIGKFSVLPWAKGGLESSIVVRSPDYSDESGIVFDMGYSHAAAVDCQHVFISHGHIDHIGAIFNHRGKRRLKGLTPATYYVHPVYVDELRKAASLLFSIHKGCQPTEEPPFNVVPTCQSDKTHLDCQIVLPGGDLVVKPFTTVHGVTSQGYIVYKINSTVDGEVLVPEVAYTGDTCFEVFHSPPNPDILRVKLLIMEATYLDGDISVARKSGHIHLNELAENAHYFKHVDHILLVHFLEKYSDEYIYERVNITLPAELRQKVRLGLTMQTLGV